MKKQKKKPSQNDTVSKLILAKVLIELITALVKLIDKLIE